MSLITTNYSQKKISEIYKNFAFIENSNSTSDRSLDIRYEIDIDLEWLGKQAQTFSMNYSTHGYINFFKTIKCKPEDVNKLLFETYIYSFVKCFYNGIFYANVNQNSDLGYAFRGHAHLFHLLKSNNNSGNSGDVMFITRIEIGNEKRKEAQLIRILKKFKFLTSFKDTANDALGTNNFWISKYELVINSLKDDHHSKQHVEQGNLTSEKEKEESNNSIYSNGRLHLMEVNKTPSSILSFNNMPLMNAFTDKDKKFYFIPVENGKNVEFNASFFYAKANFININKDKTDMSKIENYYHSYTLTSKQDHFICSEVYSNCGIKCRNYYSPEPEKIKIPTVSEIESQLNKLTNSQTFKLIEKIAMGEELNLEAEIEDIYNELFQDDRVK